MLDAPLRDQVRVPCRRRSADGDRAARRGRHGGRAARHAARRHRHRQDLHHRARGRAAPAADAGDRAEQVARGAARQRVPRGLPGERRRVLRQLLRLLPTRGLRPADRHLHREGLLGQRRDRAAAPLGDRRPCSTRRDVIIVASVSCIYGLGSPEEYEGQILRVHRGTDDPTSSSPSSASSTSSTSATRRAAREARSACRATPSRSSLRTRRPGTASSGGATRSSGSLGSTPSRARSSPTHRRDHRLPGHALRRRRGPHEARHRRDRGRAGRPARQARRSRASCSRPSACACAPTTTWR